jgi:hypothetical protein
VRSVHNKYDTYIALVAMRDPFSNRVHGCLTASYELSRKSVKGPPCLLISSREIQKLVVIADAVRALLAPGSRVVAFTTGRVPALVTSFLSTSGTSPLTSAA